MFVWYEAFILFHLGENIFLSFFFVLINQTYEIGLRLFLNYKIIEYLLIALNRLLSRSSLTVLEFYKHKDKSTAF